MRAEAWVVVVVLDPLRRVWLPSGELPMAQLPPGVGFTEFVPSVVGTIPTWVPRLLGTYPDPMLSTEEEGHRFFFGFLATCWEKLDSSVYFENELPHHSSPRMSRIIYDAFSYFGRPNSR